VRRFAAGPAETISYVARSALTVKQLKKGIAMVFTLSRHHSPQPTNPKLYAGHWGALHKAENQKAENQKVENQKAESQKAEKE